jgi:hypothetical protein
MAELFPTVYRSAGISLVTVLGRVGNIFAPTVSNFMISINVLP